MSINYSLLICFSIHRRRNDELSLRLDQLGRVNSIHVADIERYKAEIDKLKNIIMLVTFFKRLERIYVFGHVNQSQSL